jgi:hypothetical protein
MDPHQCAPPDFPGGHRAPGAGEVHLWRVALPAEDGREAARGALTEILASYLGDAARATTSAGENGKPRLAEAPGRLSFNLSHSGALALVAVTPGGVAVGVDLERLRPRRDLARLAARWLPVADAAAVAGAAEAEREPIFYAAWTRHEARVKCTGAGVDGPPPGPEVIAFPVPIDAGYAAAVAIDIAAAGVAVPSVELRRWDP